VSLVSTSTFDTKDMMMGNGGGGIDCFAVLLAELIWAERLGEWSLYSLLLVTPC
jgi:hypothetical protein